MEKRHNVFCGSMKQNQRLHFNAILLKNNINETLQQDEAFSRWGFVSVSFWMRPFQINGQTF